MSARRFKVYVVKDGEGRPCFRYDSLDDAAEDVRKHGAQGFYVCPVFAVPKKPQPEPAPLVCWSCGDECHAFEGDEHHDGSIEDCHCGKANAITYFVDGTWALTRPSGDDDDEPQPDPPGGTFLDALGAEPEKAAEGLYGCLHVDDSGIAFEALWKGRGDTVRDAGTREECIAAVEQWGGKLVRVLDNGEHEAAVEKARAEGFDAGQKARTDGIRERVAGHAADCACDACEAYVMGYGDAEVTEEKRTKRRKKGGARG